MFSRATIMLGIGPHSSQFFFLFLTVMLPCCDGENKVVYITLN